MRKIEAVNRILNSRARAFFFRPQLNLPGISLCQTFYPEFRPRDRHSSIFAGRSGAAGRLRLAIGWQLLYEGMWKIDKLDSPRPWTSAGYLKNSTGPLRDTFREMAGDPNELQWLDYDATAAKWQGWAGRFQSHYDLSDKQRSALHKLMYGTQGKAGKRNVFAEKLVTLPLEGSKLASFEKRKSAIWFDGKAQRLYIDADKLLQPDEKAAMASLVGDRNDAEARTYLAALNKVFDRQKKGLGFLRKLKGAVQGNPELLGTDLKGWEDTQKVGKLEQYKGNSSLTNKSTRPLIPLPNGIIFSIRGGRFRVFALNSPAPSKRWKTKWKSRQTSC